MLKNKNTTLYIQKNTTIIGRLHFFSVVRLSSQIILSANLFLIKCYYTKVQDFIIRSSRNIFMLFYKIRNKNTACRSVDLYYRRSVYLDI